MAHSTYRVPMFKQLLRHVKASYFAQNCGKQGIQAYQQPGEDVIVNSTDLRKKKEEQRVWWVVPPSDTSAIINNITYLNHKQRPPPSICTSNVVHLLCSAGFECYLSAKSSNQLCITRWASESKFKSDVIGIRFICVPFCCTSKNAIGKWIAHVQPNGVAQIVHGFFSMRLSLAFTSG
jgi:hypothetical protein